jgi:hypothetical protein
MIASQTLIKISICYELELTLQWQFVIQLENVLGLNRIIRNLNTISGKS